MTTATGVSHRFRSAVEARDLETLAACFTPDATFHSPVSFEPFQGRESVMILLQSVMEMFEDFRYFDVIDGNDTAALFFEAGVGDRELQGVDHLTVGPDGLITDLTVMLRPLSALMAVSEEMRRRLAGQ